MKYSFFICLTVCLFSGCQNEVVFEKNIPVSTFDWGLTDTLQYNVQIKDTISKYDISLAIRHRDIYEYLNLYVNIKTILPNGEIKSELVSLPLCDESGKWLGKCSGDICFSRILLLKKTVFSTPGNYTFLINHEMRQQSLKNVLDIGLRLTKSKKKVYSKDDE